jgi:Polycystin cation channel
MDLEMKFQFLFASLRYTMFRISVGSYDVTAMADANRVLGPVFFVLYTFIVLFTMLNVFVAIINEAYQATKTVFGASSGRIYLLGFVKKVHSIL